MTAPLDKAQDGAPPKVVTPPEAIKAIPVRHYGRYVSAVVVLALLGLVVKAFAEADLTWGSVGEFFFNDQIMEGVKNTLVVSVLSMLMGLVLGVVLAVMRMSKNPVTSSVAWGYIWFFRGTPVYVQLLLWFNLALIFPYLNLGPIYKDEMTDVMTPFMAALLGLGLNEAAYMAEICRAGIQSVDEGQTEASQALGMTSGQNMRRIVLPQAMRVIVPPTGNEFINLLKTSALCAVVQYEEVLRKSQNIGNNSGAVVEMLFVATIWFLVITTIFSIGQFYLERHYARGSSRQLPATPWQRARQLVFTFSRGTGSGSGSGAGGAA
ncbi:amino acid ABC transporter membrane protein, PAAT family (TC 3.A.1.3.-) [Streptomyces sp. WMMB 714]|jgi:polar amino acid transport system permease protein|uniref:amino acid ABC transporter permease n=1 Tax=Streptomyces sp. WMMB 714 TaxID=1286822 RepID=UPI0005F88F4E|nr:amino acid ABC transporter permease [Streptomyces sp. WMMB 714]SCK12114.1 amino acid ABC transporter membrane protein, PAAT family (TC 3.A.1.3.-) [Streptomyces sp. WMMB 714]